MSIVIWIDQNVDNYINSIYAKDLRAMNSIQFLRLYKNTEDAITNLKKIKFDETIIIVSGRLYSELVEKFKENLLGLYIIPKIIVFTSTKTSFLEFNKDFENESNNFYNFGGIQLHLHKLRIFLYQKKKILISQSQFYKNMKIHQIQSFLIQK